MALIGQVLGPKLGPLAEELADQYVRGNLVVVAGAGVSRASGLPGWAEIVATIEAKAATDLADRLSPADLGAVLSKLHRDDPVSRADSLKRLVKASVFWKRLHEALFPALPGGETFQPSTSHWHIASLVDHTLMPSVYTSNYDDLLEDAPTCVEYPERRRRVEPRCSTTTPRRSNSYRMIREPDPPNCASTSARVA